MRKLLIKLLGGLLALLGGLYTGYLYLTGLDSGGNIILLIAAIILISIAVFLLIQSSRTDTNILAKPTEPETTSAQPHVSLFEQNSQLINEWRQTEDHKNKLKILQASAPEQ